MIMSSGVRRQMLHGMEAVAFTLIGTSKERFVPEQAEFRPFDLRELRHSYNAEDNSADRLTSFVVQAS
jgi:hypothetical protein